jgi:hypothetical protein
MATLLGSVIPILEILVVFNLIVFLNVLISFETKKSIENGKKLETLIYRKNNRESKQKIKLNFKIISEKPNLINH